MRPGPSSLSESSRTLDDPVLERLVERAIAANLDLRIATAKVREARAVRGITAGEQVAGLNASGSYQRFCESESGLLPAGFLVDQNLFQVGLDASWQLDFWGRIPRAVEAAEATLEAAEGNRRDVLVILLAKVARNFVEVRAAQQRLLIARQNIQTQQESVDLTRVRFEAGLGTEVDVAQAWALPATTEAQAPVLQATQGAAILGITLRRTRTQFHTRMKRFGLAA